MIEPELSTHGDLSPIILDWHYPKLDLFDPEVWRPPVEAGEEAGLQGTISWDLPHLSHASGKWIVSRDEQRKMARSERDG